MSNQEDEEKLMNRNRKLLPSLSVHHPSHNVIEMSSPHLSLAEASRAQLGTASSSIHLSNSDPVSSLPTAVSTGHGSGRYSWTG
jgi:hypothetical protein